MHFVEDLMLCRFNVKQSTALTLSLAVIIPWDEQSKIENRASKQLTIPTRDPNSPL